jgi:protein-disulfide isomerase
MHQWLFPIAFSALPLLLAACANPEGVSPISTRIPRGNPASMVAVEVFSDLQCPACRRTHEIVERPLLEEYGPSIAFHFRHFPLQSIHINARISAEAAECAADQGKFWEFIDDTYLHQERISKEDHLQRANNLALDEELFKQCLDSHLKWNVVQADQKEGRKRGVNGTPTFFVNGERVNATLDELTAAIEQALGKTL